MKGSQYPQSLVDEVRREWNDNYANTSIKTLAKKYNISINTITDWCIRGKRMSSSKPLSVRKNEIANEVKTVNPKGVQIGGDHYKKLAIQPIEYIQKNNLGFCEGNVVKYITRWKDKNGVEDLRKARHYIDLLIEIELELVNDGPTN